MCLTTSFAQELTVLIAGGNIKIIETIPVKYDEADFFQKAWHV